MLLLVAGILCGIVNSVAGAGILFVFPALLFAGLSPLSANITLNLVAFPGTLSAAYANKDDLAKTPKKYFWLLVPAVLGAIAGLTILNNTSTETFDEIVPWLILSSVLLFAFHPKLHRHLHRPAHLRFVTPLLMVAVGFFLSSIYAGYFGAGFGFLIMALLGITKLHGIFKILAFKNFTAAIIGMIGTIYFIVHGGIYWRYGLIAATGAMIGGYLGAKFFHKVSPHTVRAIITIFGLVVAIVSFFNF